MITAVDADNFLFQDDLQWSHFADYQPTDHKVCASELADFSVQIFAHSSECFLDYFIYCKLLQFIWRSLGYWGTLALGRLNCPYASREGCVLNAGLVVAVVDGWRQRNDRNWASVSDQSLQIARCCDAVAMATASLQQQQRVYWCASLQHAAVHARLQAWRRSSIYTSVKTYDLLHWYYLWLSVWPTNVCHSLDVPLLLQ